MAEYRFIVFPPGARPTPDELRRFDAYLDLLDRCVAYGKRRDDGGLAICCAADPFDRLLSLDPRFDDLLLKWRVRGAEVRDSLAFCKAPELWKRPGPAGGPPPKPWPASREPDDRPVERQLQDAAESHGRAQLAVATIAARGRRYEGIGRWLPYALGAAAGAAVLAVGGHVGTRLLNSTTERRADALQRIAEDAIGKRLEQRRPGSTEVANTDDTER